MIALNETAADLHRKIVERPEIDELRFAFADAIQSHQPAWAQYIRNSLVTGRRGDSDPDVPKAVDELLQAPFRVFGNAGGGISRGFLNTIQVDPHVFMEHGARLLDLAPITEVHFSRTTEVDHSREFPMKELAACPHLRRVRFASFSRNDYFTTELLRQFFDSSYLDSLIAFSAPEDDRWNPGSRFDPSGMRIANSAEEERELWAFLFDKTAFRRLMRPGIGLTWLSFGDSVTIKDEYDSAKWENLTYHPMPPEHRALEQKYGYIPMLHVGNWDATVLDVMRGKKPDFPVGARPTEEMYAVPPPLRRSAWDQSEYQ